MATFDKQRLLKHKTVKEKVTLLPPIRLKVKRREI